MTDAQTTPSEDDALEDILNDIDQLLDPDAETFVKSYVQKGGE